MGGKRASKRPKYGSMDDLHEPHRTDSPNSPSDSCPLSESEHDFSDKGYISLLTRALTSFNDKEGTNFQFVKLINAYENMGGLDSFIHVNFIATPTGRADHASSSGAYGVVVGADSTSLVHRGVGECPPVIFFAEIVRTWELKHTGEVKTPSWDDSDEDDVEEEETSVKVTGLCLLRKVDSGNPLGMRCCKCEDMSVVHSGPRSGYQVVLRDKFESAEFQGYNQYKVVEAKEPESIWGRSKLKHTSDRLPMFMSCAKRALEHFNSSQHTSFRLVKVKVGFSVGIGSKRLAHLNFLAEWPEKFKEPQLFFAELVVPTSTLRSLRDWDASLEPYIKIGGCCHIVKGGLTSMFGRVCEVCVNGVMHPGCRDGYEIRAGDIFENAQFMELGNGIF